MKVAVDLYSYHQVARVVPVDRGVCVSQTKTLGWVLSPEGLPHDVSTSGTNPIRKATAAIYYLRHLGSRSNAP